MDGEKKYLRKRQGSWHSLSLLFICGVLVCRMINFEVKEKETPVVYNTERDLQVLVQAENRAVVGGVSTDAPAGATVSEFPGLITQEASVVTVDAKEKVCYLTFDDGPSVNTARILDILDEYEAKATFFVIGSQLHEGTKSTVERLIAEGHAIGIHTYTHVYQDMYETLDSFLGDYERVAVKLREEYGVETSMFRFPGGSNCTYLRGEAKKYIAEMERRGYRCFDWNVSGEDSVGEPTVADVRKNVFRDAFRYNHPIILLHDSGGAKVTVEALPEILKRLKEEGYRFETLERVEEYVFPKSR